MGRRGVRAVLIALLLNTTAAHGEEKTSEKAKELFDRGGEQYRRGNYAAALAAYEAALQMVKRPNLILSVAQCYRQLRNHKMATHYYRLYLDEWVRQNPGVAGPPPYADDVNRHLETIQQEIERAKRAREADARRRQQKSQAPSKNDSSPSTPTQVSVALAAEVRAHPPETVVLSDQASRRRRIKTYLAYSSLALGLGLTFGAAVAYGVGKSQGDSAHESYTTARTEGEIGKYRAEMDSAETKLTVGHVLIGVGAAMLGFSAYEFITRPAESVRAMTVSFDDHHTLFSLRGQF
jgi:tetratricopeptide (TPR) repeat protein